VFFVVSACRLFSIFRRKPRRFRSLIGFPDQYHRLYSVHPFLLFYLKDVSVLTTKGIAELEGSSGKAMNLDTLIAGGRDPGGGNLVEPILGNNPCRFVLFPIQDDAAWAFYKKAQASIWTAEEIDLSLDRSDYQELHPNEQHFISHVLAFFATADGIVNENLLLNFAAIVQSPEIRSFYGLQIAMENVHAETYSLLIATLIPDVVEQTRLFKAIETLPCITRKAEWALRWCNASSCTFSERLIAFAAVEGIFFSGAFCAIFWLKQRGILPGLCYSNELISRDEGLHCDFACELHNRLLYPSTPERICDIIRDAVQIEHEFVRDAIPVQLLGMNAESMCQYIEFCADRLLISLRQKRMYEVANPFPWMTMISLQGKTNFFEKRVGEYAKANVGVDINHHEFSTDAEF
jgi:ribonucleotide reductase beta subunit family protein with ferritin-like domain